MASLSFPDLFSKKLHGSTTSVTTRITLLSIYKNWIGQAGI